VAYADVQQMMMITAALIFAFYTALHNLPDGVGFTQALDIAGAADRLNAVVTKVDLKDRYNLFSGLIGGAFLALAYFGTDQSQVQRYLAGRDINQARLSLVFNGLAKIPLQFFILLIGVCVFVLSTFEAPPLVFEPVAKQAFLNMPNSGALQERYADALQQRKVAATRIAAGDEAAKVDFQSAHKQVQSVRADALAEVKKQTGRKDFSDTNYIFLDFITRYIPAGLAGLIIGVIFSAAMSAISGEVNSLATVTVIDFYKTLIRADASDAQTLWVSRLSTVFWGVFAMGFAQFARNLGNLIEAVNMVGSLFYPVLLGVFVLAFAVKRVGATAAFWAAILGESLILLMAKYSDIAFLWYNAVGCAIVVGLGCIFSLRWPNKNLAGASQL
jgi:Na+/proline symporter